MKNQKDPLRKRNRTRHRQGKRGDKEKEKL
jgi:hypothetical protein